MVFVHLHWLLAWCCHTTAKYINGDNTSMNLCTFCLFSNCNKVLKRTNQLLTAILHTIQESCALLHCSSINGETMNKNAKALLITGCFWSNMYMYGYKVFMSFKGNLWKLRSISWGGHIEYCKNCYICLLCLML